MAKQILVTITNDDYDLLRTLTDKDTTGIIGHIIELVDND